MMRNLPGRTDHRRLWSVFSAGRGPGRRQEPIVCPTGSTAILQDAPHYDGDVLAYHLVETFAVAKGRDNTLYEGDPVRGRKARGCGSSDCRQWYVRAASS